MIQIVTPLPGSYDYRLVALSIFIAISTSHTALDLDGSVNTARGRPRWAWLVAGAATIGISAGTTGGKLVSLRTYVFLGPVDNSRLGGNRLTHSNDWLLSRYSYPLMVDSST